MEKTAGITYMMLHCQCSCSWQRILASDQVTTCPNTMFYRTLELLEAER